jgi:hypothetical protein
VPLHVVLEIVLGAEFFPAPVALERFLVAVHEHVASEVQRAGEFSRAELASMHLLVFRVVSPGNRRGIIRNL